MNPIERDPGPVPIRIGRRWIVAPARLSLPEEHGVTRIRLDPGAAFGTGSHPTTRLCLLALQRHLSPGASFLDLGTGTGILAIAAALSGSDPVLAVDIDPEAVRSARENAVRNGVAGRIRVEQGSLAEVLDGRWGASPAPLVVVNILSDVILRFFKEGLAHAMSPGGVLILSGFLRSQTPEIRACLQGSNLEQMAEERMEEWICAVARRPEGGEI
jgi:ribosomal protein L11 methyltransferase